MVNWLVGTSDRFAAGVSENGVTNQVSDWANSDSGPDYARMALMGDPLSEAGMLKLWRQSPLAHVADIHTPLLILQAEADERCPKADNEQLFVALRALGRTVEYVLYPEEYARLPGDRPGGPPDRSDDPDARLVRPPPRASGPAGRLRLSPGQARAWARTAAGRQPGGRPATARRRPAGVERPDPSVLDEDGQESGVEGVAGAGRIGGRQRPRRHLERHRGAVGSSRWTEAPWAASLDDDDGRQAEGADRKLGSAVSVEQRRQLGRGGQEDVRTNCLDEAESRRPAVGQEWSEPRRGRG